MTSSELSVTVRKWAHGWELILDEDNATQVRSLAHAEQQVRDYLDTIDPETDHHDVRVSLVPEAGQMAEQIAAARQARREAERAEAVAVERVRRVVADLRHVQGYSLTDTAAILGVSRARVSQLERGSGSVAA